MPEQHSPVGHVEVDAILEALSRGSTAVIDTEDPIGDETGIEAVCDGVRREGCEQDPQGRDVLAA
jgi:hypothetical protein